MKRLLLFLTCLLTSVFVYSQITFERPYAWLYNGAAAYPDNNGYILSGMTNSPILVKIDLWGDTIWTKTLNSIHANYLYSAVKTSNDDFVFLNTPYNSTTKENIQLIRTNSIGSIIWVDSVVRQNWDYGYNIKQTSDSGFIIAGATNSLPGIIGPYPYDAYFIKTNSTGDTLWTRNYGKPSVNDYAYDIIETSDSKYVAVGYGSSISVVYLLKLKLNGDTIWTRNIGNNQSRANCVIETPDKKYLITGQKVNNGINYSDIYIIKTDTSGNVIWNKTYDFNAYESGYRIAILSNGYLIAGTTDCNGYNNQLVFLRLNDQGDTLWTKIVHTYHNINKLSSLEKCTDGGYLLTGFGFLIKTDSLGCIAPNIHPITGEQLVSVNDSITFHTSSMRGEWYQWSCGSCNIASGQGLDNITLYWDHTGTDTIFATVYNDCGSSTNNYIITIDSCVAPQISAINGYYYSPFGIVNVNKILGNDPITYNWNLSYGTIISGQGTNSIGCEWDSSGICDIQVIANNQCGSDTLIAQVQVIIVLPGIEQATESDSNVPNAFPNPFTDKLFIDPKEENTSIEIYDIFGKMILTEKYSSSKCIDVSRLTKGIYLLHLINNKNMVTKKIIKE
jgi:hypothetical protein